MSKIRKTITALGLVAISVVVRCGDDDDDDEEKQERRSNLVSSAYAEAVPMRDWRIVESLTVAEISRQIQSDVPSQALTARTAIYEQSAAGRKAAKSNLGRSDRPFPIMARRSGP